MNTLPQIEDSFLIRTDFSDDSAWQTLLAAATATNADGFAANLHVVDDVEYANAGPDQLLALADDDILFFIADRTAITTPDMRLLAISSCDGETDQIRVIPAEVWSIENNISIGNMDWDDFAEAADDDGVFRGF